jgi:hypothetical protein
LREVSRQLNPVIALARFAAPPEAGEVEDEICADRGGERGWPRAEDGRLGAKADCPERASLGH